MKFNLGDKVKVVNYGHQVFTTSNGVRSEYDALPGIVGKEGMVTKVSTVQNKPSYSVSGIPEKGSWFNEDQLELVKP